MRILLQRVKKASVQVDENIVGDIQHGLLLLLGIEQEDGEKDIEWLANKVVNLRIFADEQGVMNKSVLEVMGECLVVSQFTLHANIKKGNRPSYIKAAKPPLSENLYEKFKEVLSQKMGRQVSCGIFGADMQVELINDGPVTIWMDSKNKE